MFFPLVFFFFWKKGFNSKRDFRQKKKCTQLTPKIFFCRRIKNAICANKLMRHLFRQLSYTFLHNIYFR